MVKSLMWYEINEIKIVPLLWQVFQANAAIQGGLDPNCSYGESQGHNTPLHYASQHAMKHLCR